MPPRRGRSAANSAATASALDGCHVAFSGTFPGHTHSDLEKQVTALGGTVSSSIARGTTHLITVWADYNKPSAKVKAAKAKDIFIVSDEWLHKSAAAGAKEDESSYPLTAPDSRPSTSPTAPAPANPAAPARPPASATPAPTNPPAPAATSIPASPPAAPAKSGAKTKATARAKAPPKNQPKAKTNGSRKRAASTASPDPDQGSATQPARKKASNEPKQEKRRKVKVPLDDPARCVGWSVYISPKGEVYDASLNQTNASNNNNKFYRIQLLQSANNNYMTWTRWGRVGDDGSNAASPQGTLESALKVFEKKFKDKSGLTWEDRFGSPPAGKYTFVERSYDDSDDEGDESEDEVKCTLDPTVQSLMSMIFNPKYFQATMSALNYDSTKLPLGKLSQNTITRGFELLQELTALIAQPALASNYGGMSHRNAIENLSNSYYSLIPHVFGRARPPVIDDSQKVKTEIELLQNLRDMKDAAKIMKPEKLAKDPVHPLDRQFQGLGMAEMTPLDHQSSEFQRLSDYLHETRGATHHLNYQVEEIFRIERNGEKDRFEKSKFASIPSNRRLLWHGSRCTNYGGILSQGLRIAPPEAPVTGYMFGKGIYLADMSSKSANYCVPYLSNNTALLLLCEAELGSPMRELTGADSNAAEEAKKNGQYSTWGKGRNGPTQWVDGEAIHPSLKGVQVPDSKKGCGSTGVLHASLYYNEYICYDVAQVRLRYLLRVRI